MSSSFYDIDPGDPYNDQMLAQAREDIRNQLDTTVHHLLNQIEAANAPLSSGLAALAVHWIGDEELMPRNRLASLLALALVMLAEAERAGRIGGGE